MLEKMIEYIQMVDIKLFYAVNNGMRNPILDFIMPLITNGNIWIIPIIVLLTALLIFGNKTIRIAVLLSIIAVAVMDPICYRIIKPFVGRVRPCWVLPHVNVLVNAGRFSFPSNHSANLSAVASVFGGFYRKTGIYLFGLAFIESFSRVYVGVHYPLDTVAGLIMGASFGMLVVCAYNLAKKKLNLEKGEKQCQR